MFSQIPPVQGQSQTCGPKSYTIWGPYLRKRIQNCNSKSWYKHSFALKKNRPPTFFIITSWKIHQIPQNLEINNNSVTVNKPTIVYDTFSPVFWAAYSLNAYFHDKKMCSYFA